jgi:SAM-dependent methyltransferase
MKSSSMKSAPDAELKAAIPSTGVTRENVIWCYRMLLGREPENEGAINSKLQRSSTEELLREFLTSREFLNSKRNTARPAFFTPTNLPITVEFEPSAENLARLVERVRRTWRGLGESKPHWSVLSQAEFLPDNIDATRDTFYRSGASDLEWVLAAIRRAGRDSAEFSTVHEYGCGLGRVTNHLATVFEKVIGCDISAPHLALARERSKAIGVSNIEYREISIPDYGIHEPIDLWFSVIVLQHNPPPVMFSILRRMLAALRPGGLAIFQIPTYAVGYRFEVMEYLKKSKDSKSMEMHVLPQRAIFDLIRQSNCQLLEITEDGWVGDGNWLSNTFIVGRPAA